MRHYIATGVTAQPHALATLLPEKESAVSIGQEARLAPERVRTLSLSRKSNHDSSVVYCVAWYCNLNDEARPPSQPSSEDDTCKHKLPSLRGEARLDLTSARFRSTLPQGRAAATEAHRLPGYLISYPQNVCLLQYSPINY
jgi:hypothetical protein